MSVGNREPGADAPGYTRPPLPSRHMSDRSFAHQKARSDICFGRLIRTICCPAARHMSGSPGLSGSSPAEKHIYATTVRFLASLGHAVVPVGQLGLAQAADSDLLRVAQEQGRLLVTRDRDY